MFECAGILKESLPTEPNLCRTAGCVHAICLSHSRYCRHCVVDSRFSQDMQLDVREKESVLDLEAEVAQKAVPALQKVPSEGDPFHLYLPCRHAELPVYSAEAHFLSWNHFLCVML